MTPSQLARSGSESAHQIALFAWASVAYNHGFKLAELWSNGGNVAVDTLAEPAVPELKWMHHIPNGGSRGNDVRSQQIRGAKLKAEGVRSGVSDVCLPVKRGACSGLYIEMKAGRNKPSENQITIMEKFRNEGFRCEVCWSLDQFITSVNNYLK